MPRTAQDESQKRAVSRSEKLAIKSQRFYRDHPDGATKDANTLADAKGLSGKAREDSIYVFKGFVDANIAQLIKRIKNREAGKPASLADRFATDEAENLDDIIDSMV